MVSKVIMMILNVITSAVELAPIFFLSWRPPRNFNSILCAKSVSEQLPVCCYLRRECEWCFHSKFSNFTMHKSQIKLSQVRGEAKRNGLKQFFLHPTTTKIFWLIVTPFSTAILVVITPHWCNFSPEDQFSNAAGPLLLFFWIMIDQPTKNVMEACDPWLDRFLQSQNSFLMSVPLYIWFG